MHDINMVILSFMHDKIRLKISFMHDKIALRPFAGVFPVATSFCIMSFS